MGLGLGLVKGGRGLRLGWLERGLDTNYKYTLQREHIESGQALVVFFLSFGCEELTQMGRIKYVCHVMYVAHHSRQYEYKTWYIALQRYVPDGVSGGIYSCS